MQESRIETVPALVYPMSKDEATVSLVDSNLHREKLLPSEKAWAYRLKAEALDRQGKRSDLRGCKKTAPLFGLEPPTKRRSPKKESGEKSQFSDLLYCADCGSKLWHHYNTIKKVFGRRTSESHRPKRYSINHV